MELTAGYPFWLIKDGLPYQYPRLLENTNAETVVIGGGISGALTAYYLTNAGIDCILADSRTIGLGSTCASTSLLQYELDIPLHKLAKKIGEKNAFQAYRSCSEAIDKLVHIMENIGYKEYELQNSLFFSVHPAENAFMKEEYLARKRAGFEVDLLSGDEIGNQYALKANSAILSKTGATVNAYSLTHALLQFSLKKGLRIYDRTKITGIKHNQSHTQLTTAEGFTITAGKLINATGFEVTDFIKKDIVDFYCTYAIVSEQQEERTQPWKDRVMLWNTDDPYLYMRLTKDNRIFIGGRDERFSNKVTREAYLDKKSRLLEKDFKKILPSVRFKKEFGWSGVFGKTKDALPYIGMYNTAYYALGFGGNGITFSVLAGEIISDLIRGRHNEQAALFSFERAK
jgi:glycine/D-amino acid oxidase-like deaminating enzyme